MRRILALAAVLLAGCATSDPSVITSGGPLGPRGAGVNVCYPPRRVVADGMMAAQNGSSHPVAVTAARLTGVKGMKTVAVYAAAEPDGSAMTAAVAYGWPPARFRHSLPVTVPAGASVEVIIVVTVTGQSAQATGEDVSYTSQGQAYEQQDPWTVRLARSC